MTDFSIEHLTIQNFRGIPGVLQLDLSAPLTVIYAANGSGKSSVCQAVEWLLTGKVDAVPADSHSCIWGGKETSVTARCRIGNEFIELRRTSSGLIFSTSQISRLLSDIELLIMITPEETGADGRSDIRQKLKTEWLRSSRWLYSSALSLLVDNQHATLRKQIFANILGYGHLIPVLNKLNAYVNAIPSDRSLLTKLRRVEEEISLITISTDQSQHWLTHFTRSLDEYTALTGYLPNIDTVHELQCEDAAINAAQQEQILNTRQLYLNNIVTGQEALLSSEQRETELKERVTAHSKQLTALTEQGYQLTAGINANDRLIEASKTHFGQLELSSIHLQRWSELSVRLSQSIGIPVHLLTRENILAEYPNISRPNADRQAILKAWRFLSDNRSQWDGFNNTLKALNLKAASSPALETIIALELAKKAADDNYTKLDEYFKSLSSATEQLRALGLQLVRKSHDLNCPLCSEPQPDHQKLVDRIELAQSAMSPVTEAALKASIDAASEATKATAVWLATQKSYDEAMLAQNEIDRITQQINKIISESGIGLWERDTTPSVLSSKLEQSIKQSELTISVAIFLEEISAIVPTEGHLSEHLDYQISLKLTSLMGEIKEENLKQDDLIKVGNEKTEEMKSVQDKITAVKKDIEIAQHALSVHSSQQAQLLVSWRFLAGDIPVTKEKIQELLREQSYDLDRLQRAKCSLEQAKAALASSQEYAKHAELLRERELINKQITLRQKRLDTGNDTLNAWSQHVSTVSQNRLRKLLTPASELFSKMHANEVYQSLSMGQEHGAFCWQAIVDELSGETKTIDAESHFSQGQRQDLALSLFLARARSLKGSFFLDEPVAHLDDLNRVAMMDIFRMLTTSEPSMRLILTTASNGFRRHLRQKFSSGDCHNKLRIITLEGNPKQGVTAAYS